MLLAGSASVYLAGMDILFDLQNGIYRAANGVGNVAVELFINVGCLVGGVAIIAFAWRHREALQSRADANRPPVSAAVENSRPG
jgi:protein-S-isoprenylcysteine O-methyltransferase Ste14